RHRTQTDLPTVRAPRYGAPLGDERATRIGMCNLYNITKGPQAILDFTRAFENQVGNLEPGEIYPDYSAPIVRQVDGLRTLTKARWGMPSSKKALLDATAKRANKLRAKGKE